MLCGCNGLLSLSGGCIHSQSGSRGVNVVHRCICREVDGGSPGVGDSQGRSSEGATVGDYACPLGSHFVAVGSYRRETVGWRVGTTARRYNGVT